MKHHAVWLLLSLIVVFPPGARADDAEQMTAFKRVFDSVQPKANALTIEGRYDESQELFLKAFPEKSRTPWITLKLGDLFFKQNPEKSYALHKRAALALPNDPAAHFEWAMEQHRAKEYAAASDTYAKVIKLGHTIGGIYGLWAECLIRTGKIQEAADTWKLSEQASGTIEALESWVCDVNGRLFPDRQRAELLPKAAKGDLVAARDLIALDAAFRDDWWNAQPNRQYLSHDLELLRKTKFAEPSRLQQILCMGDCALAEESEKIGVLRKARLLVDERGTLPQDGVVLSSLLNVAISSEAISKEDAKTKWIKVIWEKAKASKDAEMFNVVADLSIGSDKMTAIDRIAWQTTGDERFAASLVVSLARSKKLSWDDADVKNIIRKFPENWVIAQVALMDAVTRHVPLKAPLVQAIKAEFTHFSLNNGFFPRPGASVLRHDFDLLSKTLTTGDK